MSRRVCALVGAGRLAGGFVAPLLDDAGWETILICRNTAVLEAVNRSGGIQLRILGQPPREYWIGGIRAIGLDDRRLPEIVAGADLLATAVGPFALATVGRALAPALAFRFEVVGAPINVLTFENHRRAPELLATGLVETRPSLAGEIGRRLGIGGVVAWRLAAHREITSEAVRFDADGVSECYAEAASLLPGVPPLDGAVPGIELVRSFDVRMVEKLWLFNAGHAAAAYLGWHAGCTGLHEAMANARIREVVCSVLIEAQQGLQVYVRAHPAAEPFPPRPIDAVLARYGDPALSDPVVRVGREPRRKLAPGDRLIGPATACLDAGVPPVALASAAAAALAYAEPSDPQAMDLQRELAFLEPEEVLSMVSGLDARDELARLIGHCYRARRVGEAAR
ncbi:MAG TPA: hypothetical protein VG370_11170 [Chloroflexota bacterium]|nr:hypothetical protein [Chloroflexota bacterium]